MHFPDELIDVSEFKEPVKKPVGKAEMTMAKQLIASMTKEWDPSEYDDDYHKALEKLIEEKIEHPDAKPAASSKKRKETNVIDLVAILQESLQLSKGKASAPKVKPATKLGRGKSKSAA